MEPMILPFATRLVAHLAASRRKGFTFHRAWHLATLEVIPQSSELPWPMRETKNVMAHAYARRGRFAATGFGIDDPDGRVFDANLEVHELLKREEPYTAPTFEGTRRCGSGDGCSEPAREGGYLCQTHAEEIKAAYARAQYRSRVEVEMGLGAMA